MHDQLQLVRSGMVLSIAHIIASSQQTLADFMAPSRMLSESRT